MLKVMIFFLSRVNQLLSYLFNLTAIFLGQEFVVVPSHFFNNFDDTFYIWLVIKDCFVIFVLVVLINIAPDKFIEAVTEDKLR